MSHIKDRIHAFNANREEETLALKYERMSENPSRFFRGTCHLFYEDIASNDFLKNAPKTWVCGDLHLENFGTFTGSDGICYFDINDFDESALAPLLWDVSRIMTSIVVFGKDLKWKEKQILDYQNIFFETYVSTLKKGKSQMIHKKTASGEIADLLDKVENRKSNYLLKTKTEKKEKFIIENEKTYKLSKDFRIDFCNEIEQKLASHPKFKTYKIRDLVGRIAGTGSLGLPRYLLLIQSKEEKNTMILDLKTARESSLAKYLDDSQPKHANHAERICFSQNILQFDDPNLLESWELDNKSFVVRNYQPSEDKIDWFSVGKKSKDSSNVISDFAKLLAWSQIRASGKSGAAGFDEILKFTGQKEIKNELIKFSSDYSQKVMNDYKEFVKK